MKPSIPFITTLLVAGLLASSAHALSLKNAAFITDAMRTCTADAECVLVDRDCGDCCDFDAVAKTQQGTFEAGKKKQCGKPSAMCDCIAPALKPACIEHRCTLIPASSKEAP